MEPMSLTQVAAATGGTLVRAQEPDRLAGPEVVTDSRQITPGALFVAILGERVNGHDYLDAAAAAGASAALVDHEVDAALPQIVVPDTVAALSLLAHEVVSGAEAQGLIVVGITGSSGKTSTKDLVAQVLEQAGPTIAPPGSFNNEIGAPLTACRVDQQTRFLVSEMGARGPGHIRALTDVTHPRIGAVLNVGHAHLGEFGSVEGIAQAKGELVEAVDAEGWAVLNADDPRVVAMRARTNAQVAVFAASGEPDVADAALRVWARDVRPDDLQRHSFTLCAAGALTGTAPVTLRVLGAHQVDNALAAAAIALAAGLTVEQVASGLSGATPRSRWRMELGERADGLAILNDAYNANPDSMHAALDTLAGLRRDGGRLLAGLGDMLELGPDAEAEHRRVGEHAAALGIDVFSVGEFGRSVSQAARAAGGRGEYLADVGALARRLREVARPHDTVLVKASRGLALERVAEALAATTDEGALP